MAGFIGDTKKSNTTTNEQFIKETVEQINSNILKIINLEVVLTIILDKMFEKEFFTKEEFEALVKEKSKMVEEDIAKQMEEANKK